MFLASRLLLTLLNFHTINPFYQPG